MNSGKHPTEDQQDSPRSRGQRLRQAIHEARASKGIDSDYQLSIVAGIHYDTLMNWFSGATVPRPAAVRKVAAALDVPYGDLLATYEGREPARIPLEQAVADLIVEIRAAVVEDRRARAEMMRAITATLAASISPPVPTMDVPAANRQPVPRT
jgi:transcriptional regulator with XRE-family HTH domain